MIHINKKIRFEIITIISISISLGIIKNIVFKESLPLFNRYDPKLLEGSLYGTSSQIFNNPGEIDAEGVMHLHENNLALLIDIRPYVKYKNGHIPTSTNLKDLSSLILPNSNKIVIIFSDESSNKLILKYYIKLIKKGVKNIFVYKKGIEDWIENGFPIEKSST